MTDASLRHGRPWPVMGALGFAGAALVVLIGREIAAAYPAHLPMLIVLAAASLGVGLFLGARLVGRLAAGNDPADAMAPALGFVAASLPLSLLFSRLGRGLAATAAASFFPPGLATALLAGLVPLGLALGAAGALAVAAARRAEPANPRKIWLFLAGGAILGALFIPLVAVPKLSPINACLDMAIGCAAIGILSAAAAPAGNRTYETWLSLLAIVFVLLLPLSGLFDDKTNAWCEPAAAPTVPAAPPAPAAPATP